MHLFCLLDCQPQNSHPGTEAAVTGLYREMELYDPQLVTIMSNQRNLKVRDTERVAPA